MAVTMEGLLGVVLSLVPLILGGAPLAVLELAAASGLSRLVGPADVEAVVVEVIAVARMVAHAMAGVISRMPKAPYGDNDIGGNERAPGSTVVAQDGGAGELEPLEDLKDAADLTGGG